jgi:hypothetical protein
MAASGRRGADRAPHQSIYDVLMDPDHPDFLDLGRLLWTLVATQWDWVDRRVETVSLVGERRFRRHMSVDCRVPPEVTDLATEMGLDRFLVPLRLVAERPLLSFDLAFGDHPVPFLTSTQSIMAERAVLRAAVDQLGRPLTDELTAALDVVAQPGQAGAPQALELLDLSDASGAAGGTATAPEELVRWAIDTLDRNVLLLADVALDAVRQRTLFKISEELGPEGSGALPFLSEIAWQPTGFIFGAYDVVATSSYHFQFIAPDGLVVAGGDLFAVGVADDASDTVDAGDVAEGNGEADDTSDSAEAVAEGNGNSDGEGDLVEGDEAVVVGAGGPAAEASAAVRTRPPSEWSSHPGARDAGRTVISTGTGHGQVLGVSAHVERVPPADSYYVEVRLRPSPDGLLRASAISACFTTLLLIMAVIFANQLDDTRLESSTALMLVLPGVVSTMWLRPGEHSLVSRLLRGTRTLLLSSVVSIYVAAAAVLVVGEVADRLRLVWGILALISAVPAVGLVQALRRCQSLPSP